MRVPNGTSPVQRSAERFDSARKTAEPQLGSAGFSLQKSLSALWHSFVRVPSLLLQAKAVTIQLPKGSLWGVHRCNNEKII
jgi:hypothetical protein